jgi:hypothetical protein
MSGFENRPTLARTCKVQFFILFFVLDIFDSSITKIFNQSLGNPKIDILLSPPFGTGLG